ncbi:MAG: rod shape-determining protein [Microgenomates group bacterium]
MFIINNLTNFLSKIKENILTPFEIYFDFGTAITKVAIKDKGIILREPTLLAYNTRISDYIFYGDAAKKIIGKTPDFIKIIKPIQNGVICDFDAQVALTKKYLDKSAYLYLHKQLIKPLMIAISTVPTIATEIEQKAVQEALSKAGLSSIFLIEKSLATASGCGINVFHHQPNLIIDLGAGLIEISIIGSGGIIAQKTLKNAGDYMNKLIYNYIYLKYGVILGEVTCEQLKTNLLNFKDEEKITSIRGKSLETGLPKTVRIKTSDIKEALIGNFNQIIDTIKELIESSPPEIVDEITEKGIYLTGGLSRIPGIDEFFSKELKSNIIIENNFEYATINGIIKLAQNKDLLSKIIIR